MISLEDPVERDVPGVTQIEVKPFGELTYERSLRSILRQDPQVLALGEIRDAATASLAVQAALSGHRLICTLHAASTGGAIARLFEMGMEPYQITSAVRRRRPTPGAAPRAIGRISGPHSGSGNRVHGQAPASRGSRSSGCGYTATNHRAPKRLSVDDGRRRSARGTRANRCAGNRAGVGHFVGSTPRCADLTMTDSLDLAIVARGPRDWHSAIFAAQNLLHINASLSLDAPKLWRKKFWFQEVGDVTSRTMP